MRFKVGDKVQAKSKEWYYKNKNSYGRVSESNAHYEFIPEMAGLCGETLTISDVETLSDSYRVEENTFKWTDSMLEDVVASSLIKGNTPFSTGELKANADTLFAIKSEEASKLPLYSEHDPVNHPDHYTANGMQCWDAIKASMTKEAFCGYLKGNAQKYIWRYEKKVAPMEDLRKASVYLNKLIEEVDASN